MSTHLIDDDTATPTTVDPVADTDWLRLSAAITDLVPPIADRDDLVVTVAPGAGHGAPACFLRSRAHIEIDGTHLDVDPATAVPHRLGDRARYATAWGLLTHECAHAAHTRWMPPDDAPPGAVAAARLLEESRIEAAHVRRRPDDRHWLRASATNLILADTRADDPDPARAPAMTRHDAAQAAALLLARATGGILTRREVAPVARVVRTVLGTDTLAALRTLWRAARKVADTDTTAMIDLGRRWCQALGIDPDDPEPFAEPDDDQAPAPSAGRSRGRSRLARSITRALGTVAATVATEPAPTDPATDKAERDATERAARHTASAAAAAVFTDSAPPTGGTTITGTRAATPAERAAARRLAAALSTAGIRDRVTVTTASALPPGRLRMRGVLAGQAQRAAGAIPTARPFTRATRRTVPTPALRVGIACDVSRSMGEFAGPVASAAWILAHAAGHAQVPATTATVIFGNHVRPLTHPGRTPTQVTEFDTTDFCHDIPGAIDALDGALDLTRPGAARLLVIVSDGLFEDTARHHGQTRITRLRAAGCGVLWLAPDEPDIEPLHGATVHPLADPTATAHAIGRAATAALRATH